MRLALRLSGYALLLWGVLWLSVSLYAQVRFQQCGGGSDWPPSFTNFGRELETTVSPWIFPVGRRCVWSEVPSGDLAAVTYSGTWHETTQIAVLIFGGLALILTEVITHRRLRDRSEG